MHWNQLDITKPGVLFNLCRTWHTYMHIIVYIYDNVIPKLHLHGLRFCWHWKSWFYHWCRNVNPIVSSSFERALQPDNKRTIFCYHIRNFTFTYSIFWITNIVTYMYRKFQYSGYNFCLLVFLQLLITPWISHESCV